ncbi:SulP family inorganic anion transporter [Pseudarthrobacter cellobiosi]|uniref:SulP family inorganic anion transporter n=1 Tax=Pseudarthrobacter cellobiosi TaxID=2953654 RepID=UPI00208F07E1|nr:MULTISPECIES: SulP family inorganic anion transporter [unclassified Pseudarthrobacter]MCO4256991.1 SulP family inorganic anion transporter [Pseudarthrobacter sp. HLT1-5]MCO4272998.1 SulP family inorganic anion transporter [Pseudarthrobacter sp. HLT3-5]
MRHDWINKALPGVGVARGYKRSWLKADLVAGAALSAALVPAGMAYAEASGLPAVNGLYASVVPMIFYALFGPSRVVIVGPDSALAPMIAAAILPLAGRDPEQAVAMAGVLAILIGLFLITGRLFKLGFVTGLLSRPIRVGYLNGIALAITVSQLPRLLGIDVPADGVFERLLSLAGAVVSGAINPAALAVGAGSLAVIVAGRFLPWKVPGVLFAVAGSVAAVALMGLTGQLPMVGALPQGLPAPALGRIGVDDVLALVGPAAGIALIAFADTSTLSKSLAARRRVRVNGNEEMGALGIANLATGVLGGFPVSGSSSRTPIVLDAGAKTQLSGVVAALLVVLFMVFAPGVTAFLPTATLAAVVIVAASSLVDVRTLVRLVRMSRMEALLLVVTFLGVAFVGVLQGIAVAIGLSLLAFVQRAWDPYRTELASLADVPGFHDLDRHPEGRRVEGLVIARFDAPLFFANGEVFADHIHSLVDAAPWPVKWVIVAAEPITGLDTTALDELVQLDDELAQDGISLVFAEMKGPVKDRLIRFGASARFTADHFFPTLKNAVHGYKRETEVE